MNTVAKISALIISAAMINSCSEWLEPVTFTSITDQNFYETYNDVNAAVTGIYSDHGRTFEDRVYNGEWSTDEYWTYNANIANYNEFTWLSDGGRYLNLYNRKVPAVTKAGSLLEVLEEVDFLEDSIRERFIAEVKVNRAIHMFDLLNNYGACPVILEEEYLEVPDNNYKPERPQPGTPEGDLFEQSYIGQIIEDLEYGINSLGLVPEQFGRMDKGIAMTVLLKLYMHQKLWSDAAQVAQDIIDLEIYDLEPQYSTLFNIENEGNAEIIWAIPRLSNINGQTFRTNTLSSAYDISDEQKWNGDKIRFEFYDTFDADDLRKNKIIVEFINSDGDTVNLRTDVNDVYGGYNLKYDRDPDAVVQNGTDVIMLRYADVLLCRAEALNEMNGPNQESVDLINEIRNRAGLDDILQGSFSSKSALRDHILRERGWEFYMEGLRREDLIRHGKFIQYGLDRGAPASPHHVLYPIPRDAYTENEFIQQNPGYDY